MRALADAWCDWIARHLSSAAHVATEGAFFSVNARYTKSTASDVRRRQSASSADYSKNRHETDNVTNSGVSHVKTVLQSTGASAVRRSQFVTELASGVVATARLNCPFCQHGWINLTAIAEETLK
jgi:hypothetical protein